MGNCPSGAVVAQSTCNRQVSGFESPLGLQDPNYKKKYGKLKKSEGWESGLIHQTVNLASERASLVRIQPPPPRGESPHSSVVEHTLGKGEVGGSIPPVGSRR